MKKIDSKKKRLVLFCILDFTLFYIARGILHVIYSVAVWGRESGGFSQIISDTLQITGTAERISLSNVVSSFHPLNVIPLIINVPYIFYAFGVMSIFALLVFLMISKNTSTGGYNG